ncbi:MULTISPECIES: hypothetical protein [unclassified Caballeronia]|uniref:hypothetical protein n=1 Tax=unclassified Caballeronia TaxID=2646786 RepID=UPI002028A00C|nr:MULTISPECIES: hypothetical protein [unclassified Caballeronia]
MQQYDITVVAGSSFRVGAAGRYIKYVSGSNGGGDASLLVTPGMQHGSKITLQPGQAYRVADDAHVPDSWTVQNAAGGATIIGKVVVGNGRIDDNSMQGVVQVVDGGKARTIAGGAFSVYGVAQAVASAYGRVQLWNPATNANRLVVENVTIFTGSAGPQAAKVQFNAAKLASTLQAGISKRADGAASAALACYDTNASFAPDAGSLLALSAQASSSPGFKLAEPIVVPPGYGLLVWASGVNTLFGCSFEWYEEPNV